MTKTVSGEVIIPGEALPVPADGRRLGTIAKTIHKEWGKGIDAQFAIGHLLIEARALMPADDAFGRWLKEQNFGFTTKTANNLRRGAEREQEVRDFIAARKETSATGRDIGVVYAMDLLAEPKQASSPSGYAEGESAPPTEPVDKALVALRAAARTALGWQPDGEGGGSFTANTLLDMHVDDLAEVAKLIQALVAAYNEAKSARSA